MGTCRLAGKVASVKLSQQASEAAATAISAARLQVRTFCLSAVICSSAVLSTRCAAG